MSAEPAALVLVVMGVSGSGKTTIVRELANRLGRTFEEGDVLHRAANVAKMHAGIPLDDADRAPWLNAVAAWIDRQRAGNASGIITCSALKRSYRDIIMPRKPAEEPIRCTRRTGCGRKSADRRHWFDARQNCRFNY